MSKPSISTFCVVALLTCASCAAWGRAREIKIPIRSELSPVQKLNREGVQAVKKHQYEKAETLFYKAYLYDPADPFTLYNLGFVAELQGRLEQAHKFYDLASEQGSDANIDLSNAKHLEGKPMKSALIDLKDDTMRVNRMNVDAMRLLADDRGFEAVSVLKHTLELEPKNPFTLNNLGVASEAIGDFEGALNYYREAAATHSSEPVVVTLDRNWRGRSVSATAEASAKRLEKRLQKSEPTQARAVMMTMRGVYAANQNDWATAKENFLQAYSLDPNSAFTLNNRGYVAEREGDLETAQFFYEKARRADDSGARVGLATDQAAKGKSLDTVANDSTGKVDAALDVYSEQRRKEQAPVELTPRGGSNPAPAAPESHPSQQDNPSAPPESH